MAIKRAVIEKENICIKIKCRNFLIFRKNIVLVSSNINIWILNTFSVAWGGGWSVQ